VVEQRLLIVEIPKGSRNQYASDPERGTERS